MEGWNTGPPQADQMDLSPLNPIVNPGGGETIHPTLPCL